MPPLLLDEDEAMAVAVLLGVSAGVAVPGIERAALATLARVDRLLPPRLQRQVKALRAATVPLMGPVEAVPAAQLASFAQACEGNELVSFGYSSREGKGTTRRVEPHRLVATDRRWYLVAFDLDRQDWRTFRVDRAKQVRRTGHTFVPRPLADPRKLVTQAISAAGYRYRAMVKFQASVEEVSKRVSPRVGSVAGSEGHATLEVGVDDAVWLTGYLIGLGLPFEVEAHPNCEPGSWPSLRGWPGPLLPLTALAARCSYLRPRNWLARWGNAPGDVVPVTPPRMGSGDGWARAADGLGRRMGSGSTRGGLD